MLTTYTFMFWQGYTIEPLFFNTKSSSLHLSISPLSPRWCPRPVRRYLPSDPVPLFCPPRAFLFSPPASSSVFPPQEGTPTSALGVPRYPPFQPPYPGREWARPWPKTLAQFVCSVYAGLVAFLYTVCDQWCHGTHFTADYLRLALC